jgi:hypothetical protein
MAYIAKAKAILGLMEENVYIMLNQLHDLNDLWNILEQNQQVNNEYVCESHQNDEEDLEQYEDFQVVPENKNVRETEPYLDHDLLTLHSTTNQPGKLESTR